MLFCHPVVFQEFPLGLIKFCLVLSKCSSKDHDVNDVGCLNVETQFHSISEAAMVKKICVVSYLSLPPICVRFHGRVRGRRRITSVNIIIILSHMYDTRYGP